MCVLTDLEAILLCLVSVDCLLTVYNHARWWLSTAVSRVEKKLQGEGGKRGE